MVMHKTNYPTGLSPLLNTPSSCISVNAQQSARRVQFLLSMCQYQLSKEEAGKLVYQRFHVVTTTLSHVMTT